MILENEKQIPRKVIFEINNVNKNDEYSGCPVCPTCRELAYDKDKCCFCGQVFLVEDK